MTKEKMSKKEEIFSKGCLTPEKHGQLVAEIEKYAAAAGLGGSNMRYIWSPIEKYGLEEKETVLLKGIKKLGKATGHGGALYIGQPPGTIADRFMALTGCMVRNYVDARFMPLEAAIQEHKEQRAISAAVVCIPNFHTGATCLQLWQKSVLHDLLLQHLGDGKLIVGYVENAAAMRSAYPLAIYDLLKTRLIGIGGAL